MTKLDDGTEDLKRNLQAVKRATAAQIKNGLEYSANEVIKHAQGKHVRGKNLPRSVTKDHPSDRFYTWSGVLVNSMQAGDVVWNRTGAEIAAKAVAPYAEYVEAPQELNPATTKRAFPFMKPALDWFEGKFLRVMLTRIKRVFV